MARSSDNGLYLPLKVDLSGWEQSLAAADADLQKTLREMRSELKSNQLKFDVEISGAKAVGDELKVYELEVQKLSQKMQYQNSIISGLKKRLGEMNPEKDATGYKKLSEMIDKETISLNKMQVALNNLHKAHEESVNARIQKEKELQESQEAAAKKQEEILKKQIEKEKELQEAKETAAKKYTNENKDLKYDVQIKLARQVGDAEKAKRLEIEKTENSIKRQKQLLVDLAKQIREQAKLTGKNSVEVKELTNNWLKQKNILIDLYGNLKNLKSGTGFTDILNQAKQLSPELAKLGGLIGTVGSKITGLASMAGALNPVSLAIAAVVASLVGGYKVLKSTSEQMRNLSNSSAEAAESVFMLAERLNLTYQDAEQLDSVFTLDGSSAETFINAMQKLNKQLLNAGEEENLASFYLKKYNVELRNADGTQKSYTEQLKEMAEGYKAAKEAGEELDFITATLGSGGNQYIHLLNGLDDYIAKTKELTRAKETDYDLNHEILTVDKQLVLQKKELAKATGGIYNDSNLESKKKELEFDKRRTELANENKEMYKELADNMKIVNEIVVNLQGNVVLWLDRMKAGLAENIVKFGEFLGLVKKQNDNQKNETQKQQVEIGKPEIKENKKTDSKYSGSFDDYKKVQDAEKKLNEAKEKFNREFRDAISTDYQKEINALEDKRKAYIAEQISEVEANKLYSIEKAKVDEKYFNKLKQEREKQSKDAEATYKKEIEDAKRAREQSISNAESTLKSNLQILRYIEKMKKQGTYNENDIKAYAERLYLKQNGFKMSDVAALKSIGVDKLKDLANARDRIFGQFANTPDMGKDSITNNNNITINFDNTVLDNVQAMDLLANKVAAIIEPAIKKAVAGNGGNSYGYTN